ncbi:FHA domain-containing protein At4g14490-like [Selaginella moellendorffii]|uniref:FHA domain-containing protein At4g14490-like n=1 Tax=Selaginella moellendorffii TaxID=88036 RepID=UPI000D1C422D|nr:FHA domain-containing protein At4g14490-like [Selaginella moellendorffii]|eukprot:XP_024534807.1 FHA domain-containing protein At4g14490-like [Selaginella moellendorffii]
MHERLLFLLRGLGFLDERRSIRALSSDIGSAKKMPTPLTLRVEEGIVQGTTFDSGRLKHITIGRTRTNRFQIKDETISQKHMSVDWVDDAWAAQDLGSSNGTTVNGVSIGVKTPYRLYNDDLLRIGVDTRIRVIFHDGSGSRKLESVKEEGDQNAQEEEEDLAGQGENVKNDAMEERIEQEVVVSTSRAARRRPTTSKKAKPVSQSTEMTLRDWFRQEMVRVPTILHERAEATIREMEIHAEQLRESYVHLQC